MREIKFRAWNRTIDKMKYGVGVYEDLLVYYMDYDEEDLDVQGDVELFKLTDKRFTLMQYTGLKDKNGKEIYEGDVLTDGDGEWTNNDTQFLQYIAGVVMWWNYSAQFYLAERNVEDSKWYSSEDNHAQEADEWNKYEVIGNIYENPELINA